MTYIECIQGANCPTAYFSNNVPKKVQSGYCSAKEGKMWIGDRNQDANKMNGDDGMGTGVLTEGHTNRAAGEGK